jgi:hypothetical protein
MYPLGTWTCGSRFGCRQARSSYRFQASPECRAKPLEIADRSVVKSASTPGWNRGSPMSLSRPLANPVGVPAGRTGRHITGPSAGPPARPDSRPHPTRLRSGRSDQADQARQQTVVSGSPGSKTRTGPDKGSRDGRVEPREHRSQACRPRANGSVQQTSEVRHDIRCIHSEAMLTSVP